MFLSACFLMFHYLIYYLMIYYLLATWVYQFYQLYFLTVLLHRIDLENFFNRHLKMSSKYDQSMLHSNFPILCISYLIYKLAIILYFVSLSLSKVLSYYSITNKLLIIIYRKSVILFVVNQLITYHWVN